MGPPKESKMEPTTNRRTPKKLTKEGPVPAPRAKPAAEVRLDVPEVDLAEKSATHESAVGSAVGSAAQNGSVEIKNENAKKNSKDFVVDGNLSGCRYSCRYSCRSSQAFQGKNVFAYVSGRTNL